MKKFLTKKTFKRLAGIREAFYTPPSVLGAGFRFAYSSNNVLYIMNNKGEVTKVPEYMKLYYQYGKLEWKRCYGAYRFANNYDDTTEGKYLIRNYPHLTPKCRDILHSNLFVQISDEYEVKYYKGDTKHVVIDVFSGSEVDKARYCKMENGVWKLKS